VDRVEARAPGAGGAGGQGVGFFPLEKLDHLAAGGRYVSALDRALLSLGLGEKEKALDWIEKAFEDRPSLLPYLGVDPLWDELRESPRFRSFLKRLGLDREKGSGT
jgi:hypothetical protein